MCLWSERLCIDCLHIVVFYLKAYLKYGTHFFKTACHHVSFCDRPTFAKY